MNPDARDGERNHQPNKTSTVFRFTAPKHGTYEIMKYQDQWFQLNVDAGTLTEITEEDADAWHREDHPWSRERTTYNKSNFTKGLVANV